MELFGKSKAGWMLLTQATNTQAVAGMLPNILDVPQKRLGAHSSYATKVASYYDILELTPKASQQQVKAAYYRLSKLYHPDVNSRKDAQKLFSQVSEAYEVLGNVHQRKMYDRGLLNPLDSQESGASSPFQYEEFVKKHSRKGKPPTGRTNIYDFDEFYRQHYGESREKQHFSRQTYEKETSEANDFRKKQAVMMSGYLLSLLGLAFFIISRKKIF